MEYSKQQQQNGRKLKKQNGTSVEWDGARPHLPKQRANKYNKNENNEKRRKKNNKNKTNFPPATHGQKAIYQTAVPKRPCA